MTVTIEDIKKRKNHSSTNIKLTHTVQFCILMKTFACIIIQQCLQLCLFNVFFFFFWRIMIYAKFPPHKQKLPFQCKNTPSSKPMFSSIPGDQAIQLANLLSTSKPCFSNFLLNTGASENTIRMHVMFSSHFI
jgi:hypothetical protein